MRFGLEELKLLSNTINEIAVANNMPLNEAQQKFFKDIEEQYDKKIGFESKVQNLKTEVNTLTQEKKRLHEELLAQPLIGPILFGLFQIGVNEQDILIWHIPFKDMLTVEAVALVSVWTYNHYLLNFKSMEA